MHDMSTPITQHWLHYKYMLEPFELFHNISSTMSFKHLSVFLVSAILLITSNFATSFAIFNPNYKNVAEKSYDQISPPFVTSIATLSLVPDPWDDDPHPAPILPDPIDPYEPEAEIDPETKRINPTNAKIPPTAFDYKPVFEKQRLDQISSSFDSSVAKLSQSHEDHLNHDPFEPNLHSFSLPTIKNYKLVFERSHNSKTIFPTPNNGNPTQVANFKDTYLHNP